MKFNTPIQILTEVRTLGDAYLIEEPTHLITILSPERISWIKKMMGIVKSNDLKIVGAFDSSPDYLIVDEDTEKEYTAGTECVSINIGTDSFYWSGIIKHTDVKFESERISLDHLKTLQDFINYPIDEMPKYINDEDIELKHIAKKRLEGKL